MRSCHCRAVGCRRDWLLSGSSYLKVGFPAALQDFLAGGTKGGMWRPQRIPTENVAMYQWGYNQV
jgi:hypothetical protein